MMESGQVLPVRVYQTDERIMLAVPMPGVEPEDILVRIDGRRVAIHGEERGPHQSEIALSIAEWSIGPYHRELELTEPVDGSLTNATHGNGVLVLSMPKVSAGHAGAAAEFRLITVAGGRGERVGHVGRHVVPHSTEEHWADKHAAPGGRRGAYGRILVPLDGSREAEAILPLVKGLVDPVDGDVVLLRVLMPVPPLAVADMPSPLVVEAAQEVQAEVEEYLSGLARRLTDDGLRVQAITRSGDPAGRIVETARALDAALIAMTTQGRSGISRVVFGSVAESVVREAPVPVLLMRTSRRDAIRHAA
jgi:HSP20 family protein